MKYRNIQLKIYNRLLKHYGPQNWWPAKTRFEVIVGAILTQNVNWNNAKIAVDTLKRKKIFSPCVIITTHHKLIASAIKSSRFYNQKTKKLKSFCNYLLRKYNGSLNKMFSEETDKLRKELLSIKGIGKETADSILLYAGKKLSFVSDAYTKRFLERYGLLNDKSGYDDIRYFFMSNLPQDVYIYNEFHALIVHHCYNICKSKPNCSQCPIRRIDKNNDCYFAKKTVTL